MADIILALIIDVIGCLPLIFVMIFIFGLVGLLCRGGAR